MLRFWCSADCRKERRRIARVTIEVVRHSSLGCSLGSSLLAGLWLALAVFPSLAPAQSALLPTEDVFRQFSSRVVEIEVQETGSAAKASIGSGFYVSVDGHLATNYHVVSKLVQYPERYRARIIGSDDEPLQVEVLAVDVAHDLAIVRTDRAAKAYFTLVNIEAPQGLRLYSMGHPLDLGLNIVEGTYNGFLKHALDQRIHFTGSLNPGMSGGPAITADGRVAGINVATAGDQVSFLVPVKWAIALLEQTRARSFQRPESMLTVVRDQMLSYQEGFVSSLIQSPPATTILGSFELPTQPAPYFNCWADAYREDALDYETVDHQCSTDDYVFVSEDLLSAKLWFYHRLLTSHELNSFQFSTLYSEDFGATYHGMGGNESEVTPFKCNSGTVRRDDLTFKTVFCLRGYRRLSGLYDLVFKAAVVGRPLVGLETALLASGVSFENAESLVRWYLGAVSWAE